MSKTNTIKILVIVLILGGAILLAWRLQPRSPVAVGERAPDFTLPDQNGNKVSLNQFLGKKNVVLAFYVLAFTGG